VLLSARQLESGATLEYDVCIVGAGPAGITLAMELQRPGMRVLLLEAGKVSGAGASRDLYRGSVSSPATHPPLDRGRARALGGTSSLWGGRCIPFDAIDFEKRDYVPHSGWPIQRADLDRYYERAHAYCDCGDFVYDVACALPDAPRSLISGLADAALVTSKLERWSPPTHFGRKFRADIARSAGVSLLTRALALRLRLNAEGTAVDHVEATTLKGKPFRIRSKYYVVAGGGMESTRLLLVSNDVQRAGIGNHSGWLGRAYMSHFDGVVARVVLEGNRDVVFGYELDRTGVYCRRRLWLSEAAQRSHGLLNFYAVLDRPLLDDPGHGDALFSAAYLLKLLLRRPANPTYPHGKYALYWAHLRNVLTGAPRAVSILPRFGRRRFLHQRRIPSLLVRPRSNVYHLYFHAEQAPDPSCRLRLSDARDAFGIPRLHLEFRLGSNDVDSVYRSHQLIDRELRAQGCGRLEFERAHPVAHIAESQAVAGHHLGTTRMAQAPAEGVVDANCRVFGVGNLFVASGSVFPTCSHANPTLTVVALSVRLAEHLRRKLDLSQ
jgi:choline dehydrogenase-like flavoprotein